MELNKEGIKFTAISISGKQSFLVLVERIKYVYYCSQNKSELQPNVEPKIFKHSFWKVRFPLIDMLTNSPIKTNGCFNWP